MRFSLFPETQGDQQVETQCDALHGEKIERPRIEVVVEGRIVRRAGGEGEVGFKCGYHSSNFLLKAQYPEVAAIKLPVAPSDHIGWRAATIIFLGSGNAYPNVIEMNIRKNLLTNSRIGRLSLVPLVALAGSASSSAQRVWTGESSNLWGNANNWSGSVVPGVADEAVFNNPAAPGNPIIIGASRTIQSFTYSDGSSRVFSTTSGPHTITTTGNTRLTVSAGRQLVIGSAIAAGNVNLTTGTLLKEGAGELVLFGGNTLGQVIVNGGRITARNSSALGGSSSIELNGSLRLISNSDRPIVMAGLGTVENLSDDAVRLPIMTGGVTGGGTLTIRSLISSASGFMTFSIDPINHGGDLILENSGVGTSADAAGEVRINSAVGANVNNVTIRNVTTGTRGAQSVLFAFDPKLYTGTTTINAGARLDILAANLIPNSSVVTVDGTLNLRSFSETIGALNGAGTITRTTTSDTLAIGSGNGSGVFSGTIQNGTSGSLFLLKTGSGMQELSGANSHSGGTTVSQGTLRVSNATGSATGSGSVQVFTGATLTGSGSIAGAMNVEGTVNPGVPIGTLTVGGNVAFSTGGVLCIGINDAATPKNDRLVIAGTLTASVPQGVTATLDFETTGNPTQPAYIVATYTGTPPANFKATNVPPGYIVDFAFGGNSIALINPYRVWAEDVAQGLTKGVNDGKTDDPNRNGIPNLLEFASNGNPMLPAPHGRIRKELADADPGASVSTALTVTLPVRTGAIFDGPGDLVSQPVDGIVYRIGASGDLADFISANVTEITGNAHIISTLGIQPPGPGWTLRTFRAPGAPGSTVREFIRVGVE